MAISLPMVFFIGFIVLQIAGNVESGKPMRAMFVFGDSYADTGNHDRTTVVWHPPYGITFPGKPSGRHSDGKVLTDFIASFFNMTTPVPYNRRNSFPNLVPFGMNFASGGTGIFDTVSGLPNATAQINQLQEMLRNGVYSRSSLASSLVLFSISGNDYGFYVLRQRSDEGLSSFVEMVTKQFAADLERLYGMGLRQFAVTNMGPLGCLPLYTAKTGYKSCNDTANAVAKYHNTLLEAGIKAIRKRQTDANFVLLDHYSAALSILQHADHYGKYRDALKPCCMGECGGVDAGGRALYSVCKQRERERAFFWDVVHPSHAAWLSLIHPFTSSLRFLHL